MLPVDFDNSSTLQKQTDDQLFVVDTKGDDRGKFLQEVSAENLYENYIVRKALPRYSKAELTATKILSQRSAIPAVFSRPTKDSASSRSKISRADKERLLRIAKRPRKGPFNAVMDHTEFGAGSAIIDVSAAVKHSGSYDPWIVEEVEDVADGLEHTKKPKIKASPPFTTIRHALRISTAPGVISSPRCHRGPCRVGTTSRIVIQPPCCCT